MAVTDYSKRKRDINYNLTKEEEVVYLRNCRGGLGIKICGGQMSNGKYTGIFVKRIMIGGVAAQDGTLQEGDHLLRVNSEPLNEVTNDQAVILLRREAQKGNVKLIISRSDESRSKFEELFGEASDRASPLSLSQLQGVTRNSTLSRNSSITSTGSIESPHLVRKRSWIYNNGRMSPSPSHYCSLPNLDIGSPTGENRFEAHGDRMLSQAIGSERQNTISRKVKTGLYAENRSPSLSTVDSGLPSTSPYPSPGNSENNMFNNSNVQKISVPAERGLGISVLGGSNRPCGPFVYIDSIISGCDADVDGRLQSGDLIVSINKESFTGVTYEQARAILMRLKVKKEIPAYTISFIRNPKEPSVASQEARDPVCSEIRDVCPVTSEDRILRDEKERMFHNRVSDDNALMDELAEMMNKLKSEKAISPSSELKFRTDDYPQALLTQHTELEGLLERNHEYSRSLPRLTHTSHEQFIPNNFSTPQLKEVNSIPDRSIKKYLMQDLQEFTDDKGRASSRNRSNRSRRLSLDPNTRIQLKKLKEALEYLGYELDEKQENALKQTLFPDQTGSIAYGEFVLAAREALGLDSSGRSRHLNELNMQLAVRDLEEMDRRDEMTSTQRKPVELSTVQRMSFRGRDDFVRLSKERDEALSEVEYLREKLKDKERSCTKLEEDLESTRQEIQETKRETEGLRNRVQLANEAQRAARITEQDNDLLIQKLEKEITSVKSNGGPSHIEFNELQKRLVVLSCQLRKVEVSKRTYEVAVEKLTKFAEVVHESLGDEGKSTFGSRRGSKASKRSKQQVMADLAKEACDTVKAVKLLLEEEPLPFGWEEVYSPNGARYYINHVTQTTSWSHPISGVQHLTTIVEDEPAFDKRF